MKLNFYPKALILDFDGVFTDNKVYTDSLGQESILCSKYDSLAISNFKDLHPEFKMVVISSEKNKSIFHRCNKLGIELVQGVKEKLSVAKSWAKANCVELSDCIFLCNDTNDIELSKHIGFPIGVRDSSPSIYKYITARTSAEGGNGAIAEVLDLINSIITGKDCSLKIPQEPLNESIGPRDWGEETLLHICSGQYSMKKIFIKKGSKGGLQRHQLKDESAYVVSGRLLIRYDKGNGTLNERILEEGDSIRFRPGCIHQEEGLEDTILIECSTPHFNDRIRMENKYQSESENSGLKSTSLSEIIYK